MHKIILTGPPFAGKTEVLKELARRKYQTVDEAETPFRESYNKIYGPDETQRFILDNYTGFKTVVGNRQLILRNAVREQSGLVFFDREAICWIEYCNLRKRVKPLILDQLAESESAEYVFFLEGLHNFNERRENGCFMTKEDRDQLGGMIWQSYKTRGFNPRSVIEYHTDKERNIDARIDYILSEISAH